MKFLGGGFNQTLSTYTWLNLVYAHAHGFTGRKTEYVHIQMTLFQQNRFFLMRNFEEKIVTTNIKTVVDVDFRY